MFTYNQGQNMNAPSGSPLQQAVNNAISTFGQDLIRRGLSQYQANNVANQLMSNIQNICNAIARDFPSGVDGQIVYNYVTQIGSQIISQSSNQQPGGGVQMGQPQMGQPQMGQPHMKQPMGGPGGGFSMGPTPQNSQMGGQVFSMGQSQMNQPSSMSFRPNEQMFSPGSNEIPVSSQGESAPIEQLSHGDKLGVISGESPQYDFEEEVNAGTEYSIKSILSVPKRIKIIEGKQNTYYYNRALSHIPEASIDRTINNYVRTASDRLTIGKWVTLLCYKVFDLRHFKAHTGGKIDTSHIDADNIGNIPPDTAIRRVLDSIGDLNHAVASAFGELLTEKMNDYLERFVRVETDISRVMEITSFGDIAELPSIRNEEFRHLTNCDQYEQTVVWCFRKALEELLAISPRGFYDTDEIAPHLVSHPKFLIRTNDFCERNMDLTNPDLINTIKSKYTAFSRVGEIAFTNFIPKDLDADITGNLIAISSPKNVLETIISRIWAVNGDIPEAVVLQDTDAGTRLVIKIGRTMDTNQLFYFKSNVDLKQGE